MYNVCTIILATNQKEEKKTKEEKKKWTRLMRPTPICMFVSIVGENLTTIQTQ